MTPLQIEVKQLSLTNNIRLWQGNVVAWAFRQETFGEDWTAMIAWAEAKISALEAEVAALEEV